LPELAARQAVKPIKGYVLLSKSAFLEPRDEKREEERQWHLSVPAPSFLFWCLTSDFWAFL
jgi:hypothetical protein